MKDRLRPRGNLELSSALMACRGAFLGVAAFSGLINVLMLTGSIFMLEVYDRVLPSRSVPTLVGLSAIALAMFTFQGALDVIRARIMSRIGAALDDRLNSRVYGMIMRLPLRSRGGEGLQPLRDLDSIRSFMGGAGPTAFFDLPWLPFYLLICFAFHPLIGLTALGGAIILVVITLMTESMTREPAKAAYDTGAGRNVLGEAGRRNAEVLQAMGMGPRIAAMWGDVHRRHISANLRASDVAGGFGAVSKTLRMVLQSAVLAVGAYLAIHQEVTAGIIIASSILMSRALAPVELAIGNWKGFLSARQAWRRLSDLLTAMPEEEPPMDLPAPRRGISVEAVSVMPPGERRLTVLDATFALSAGQGLGIIGPSASGKSTLARALVGVWLPVRGKVRIDGAALEQWNPESLGRHIGYLPQDIELIDGTVAQNIARFDPDAPATDIIKAAQAANVHDLILRLPDGYETRIGEGGTALSAGQRQRIALARALYGDPFLVVLDEPNSNLDAQGEEALTGAILGVRQRGGIVVVVAHRQSALNGVDTVLVMGDGKMQAFGPKEEVLSKVLRRPAALPSQLKVVAENQG